MLSIPLVRRFDVIGASVSEAPSCGHNGRAVTIEDVYIYISESTVVLSI